MEDMKAKAIQSRYIYFTSFAPKFLTVFNSDNVWALLGHLPCEVLTMMASQKGRWCNTD